jgi:hypothetical protein
MSTAGDAGTSTPARLTTVRRLGTRQPLDGREQRTKRVNGMGTCEIAFALGESNLACAHPFMRFSTLGANKNPQLGCKELGRHEGSASGDRLPSLVYVG